MALNWETPTDMVRQTVGLAPITIVRPSDAARVARSVMRLAEQETLVALYLNVRSHLLGEPHVVAIGTLESVGAYPRDVFREAILRNAAAIVILHNHPSGDPTPSDADLMLTVRLKAAGELVGILVVDHVVVTADRYTSIAQQEEVKALFSDR